LHLPTFDLTTDQLSNQSLVTNCNVQRGFGGVIYHHGAPSVVGRAADFTKLLIVQVDCNLYCFSISCTTERECPRSSLFLPIMSRYTGRQRCKMPAQVSSLDSVPGVARNLPSRKHAKAGGGTTHTKQVAEYGAAHSRMARQCKAQRRRFQMATLYYGVTMRCPVMRLGSLVPNHCTIG
jgi:hypothetical protein